MRSLVRLAAIVALLAVSGCFHHQENYPAESAAYTGEPDGTFSSPTNSLNRDTGVIMTPENGLNGTISRADSNLRFVVLTFPVGQMAAVGQHLSVYRKGLKVGELTVTGPQNDDSTVADITAGEAAAGDEVRNR